jgi:ribosomal protein S18 acetylase RimI-like enzyme
MSNEQPTIFIRPLRVDDRNWVADFLDKHWYSTKLVSRGQVYYGHLLPGFAAFYGGQDTPTGKAIGLLTYRIEGDACEITTIDSLQPGQGVATNLLETLKTAAAESGYKRLWLCTTNDNMEALRFFQKRGFHISEIHINALTESRKLKPQIPILGKDDIPLRDEIVLELLL